MVSFRARRSVRRYVSAAGIAALCALLAALFLIILPQDDSVLTRLRQTTLDILTPIYDIAAIPLHKFHEGRQALTRALDVYDENKNLRRRNRELQAQLDEATHMRVELRKYQALLALPSEPNLPMASARVVADLNSPFVHTLLANNGREAGVQAGQAVIGGRGLVGRVLSVGRVSSRILLLTDFNSHVPVTTTESQVRAILSGRNAPTPILQFLPRKAKLLDGETLLTSGDGGLIPAGLPVGQVRFDADNNPYVALHEDLTQIDYVRIVLSRPISPPPDTQKAPQQR